ncbi:MAG: CDP-diacylglycerol--glycerol-3-phosphate 3-phosphatidyltransferase [Hyphomicrobiaceae bacterium]
MEGAITKAGPTSVPNLLTYGRIAAVPAMAAVFLLLEGDQRRWIALAIFVAACFTDWLDGFLARIWRQQSMLGRMLDPIADKLLVGAALILLVQDGTISTISVWAALIILSREILVSGLREFLAELNVRVHVSRLAKLKTTLQMIALAVLLAGPAGERQVSGVMAVGTVLLWVAALLTIWTGGGYLTAAIRSTLDR